MNKPRPCRRCGGSSTTMRDGKLFCALCSEQIEEFFEVDEDEDFAMGASVSQVLKTPKKPAREGGAVEEEENLATPGQKSKNYKRKPVVRSPGDPTLPATYNEELNDTAGHSKDDTVGPSATRIGSFAKMLRKLSSMMIIELRFPEHYKEHVHYILQLYLYLCGVAFVEEEYTEDADRMFKKAVMEKRNKNNIAENLKRLKLEKKAKGTQELEKTKDAWDFLQETRMTENFELSSEDDEANQTKREEIYSQSQLKIIETNLSKSAKERAENFYLNMDLVVGILYVASISSGCVWVTISDIVRWIREDRGKIFGEIVQISSIKGKTGRGYTHERSYNTSLSVPLFELCRTCSWLHQFLAIETSLISPGYPQLAARYLYNLNLPTDMMERVLVLMDCAPLSDTFDDVYLTQQGYIAEGNFDPRVKVSAKKGQNWFGGLSATFSRDLSMCIAIETKILAYILLALKLVYGLDDKREFESTPSCFDPAEWLYQLKMRILLWEGHAVNDVLNKTKVNYPLTTFKTPFEGKRVVITAYGVEVQGWRRVGVFETLLPSITPCETAFQQDNPLVADVTDRYTDRNDEDRIYAPAQAQATTAKKFMAEKRSEKFNQKLKEQISVDSYQILVTDYGEQRIGVSQNAEPTKGVYGSEISSTERCGSIEKETDWKRLFPCFSGYVKYPHPIWAQHMIINRKETNSYYKKLNKRINDQRQGLLGPRSMFLSTPGASDLYETAKMSFSSNFAETLDLFSKCISEHRHALYAALVMLETQIVERAEYKAVCTKIIDGTTFPLPYMLKKIRNKIDCSLEYGDIRVSVDEKISTPRELRWLRFGVPKNWGIEVYEDNSSDSEFGDSSESEVEEITDAGFSPYESNDEESTFSRDLSLQSEEVIHKKELKKKDSSIASTQLYDWKILWRLITMRYW